MRKIVLKVILCFFIGTIFYSCEKKKDLEIKKQTTKTFDLSTEEGFKNKIMDVTSTGNLMEAESLFFSNVQKQKKLIKQNANLLIKQINKETSLEKLPENFKTEHVVKKTKYILKPKPIGLAKVGKMRLPFGKINNQYYFSTVEELNLEK